MKILASGLKFPEGPVVMADGSVVVTEIRAGRLSRVAPDGSCSVVAETGGGPNGAALGPDGLLYVCNNGGLRFLERDGIVRPIGAAKDYDGGRIERVDPATGKVERLYERCGEHKLAGPNDIVLDGAGGFWFTDSGKHHHRHVQHGGIYWAKLDGSEIREVIYPLPSPNGIGLSPDGKTLYVSDTASARLYAWDITGSGTIAKKAYPAPIGGTFIGGMLGPARFDSLAVSASGKICVAAIVNGGIAEFWPDGSVVRHHPLPDLHVTNLAFGGADMRKAYVTFSQAGQLVEVDWHEPGLKLFDGRDG
ncbi:MAG: SMP-30/gluconolactonase/LRE family protein [Sphingomonadaceae bacterium]|nr:SMP-30/gluconolactonase/LRE family protein [Sphingomonadaceae bacterium]